MQAEEFSAVYSPYGSSFLLQISRKPLADTQPSMSGYAPIVVLDKSGSMAGSAIASCVVGIRELASLYFGAGASKFYVVQFDNNATDTMFDSIDAALKYDCQGDGGTRFDPAYQSCIKCIQECRKSGLVPKVYFMTDGQGVSSPSAELKFKNELNLANGTVDVLGFSSGHDVVLLNRIASFAAGGTFQYASSVDQLKEIIGGFFGISISSTVITVKVGGVNKDVVLKRDSDGLFTGYLDSATKPSDSITICEKRNGAGSLSISLSEKVFSESVISQYRVDQVHSKLHNLASRLTQLQNDNERKQFDQELKQVDREVTEISAGPGKKDLFLELKPRERRKVIGSVNSELKQLVNQLYKARAQNLGTHEMATLLAQASSHITKGSLQKKLMQRVLNNADNGQKFKDQVDQISQSLSFDGYTETGLTCSLTLSDYQELAKEGDCLCLALKISRTQAAVADPSQVNIHQVFPTMISLSAFKDAVDMKLLEAGAGDSAEVTGGFNAMLGKSSQVVKGLANEGINAVLPLYINAENWKVAKLLMRESLGWIATSTWEGYTFAQVALIPFMILEHQLRTCKLNPTEHNKKLVGQLEDICRAVHQFGPAEKTLEQERRELIENFITKPECRTVDVVPSLHSMLASAHILGLANDRMALPYFEEKHRRSQFMVEQGTESTHISNILGVDFEKFITIKSQEKAETGSEGIHIRKQLGLLLDGKVGDLKVVKSSEIGGKPESWSSFITIREEKLKDIRDVWTYFVAPHFSSVSEPHAKILAAVLAQNIFHRVNSARREAIESGQYRNPFNNADVVIEKVGDRVMAELQEKKDREAGKNAMDALVERFLSADLYTAAGIFATEHSPCRRSCFTPIRGGTSRQPQLPSLGGKIGYSCEWRISRSQVGESLVALTWRPRIQIQLSAKFLETPIQTT